MNSRLVNLIDKKIEECYQLVEAYYPERKFARPTWNFDVHGSSDGKAYMFRNEMSFNEHLLIHNEEEFIKQTVPHEIAHLIASRLCGDTKHGGGWKHVMANIFGLEPKRCHEYDNVKPARKVKKYSYVCECSTIEVSAKIHNNILKGHFYRCKTCKTTLMSKAVKKALSDIRNAA